MSVRTGMMLVAKPVLSSVSTNTPPGFRSPPPATAGPRHASEKSFNRRLFFHSDYQS